MTAKVATMVRTARTLVLMRHAKAERPNDVTDIDRPLTTRGRSDSRAAGSWLAEHMAIDLIMCSPATRARQTADLILTRLPHPRSIRHDTRLYEHGSSGLLEVARELPDDAQSVILVTHNPDLENLTTILCGTRTPFRTSTIAVLTGSGSWADIGQHWATQGPITTPRAT